MLSAVPLASQHPSGRLLRTHPSPASAVPALEAQLARWRKEVARLQGENYRLRTQLVGFLRGPEPLTPGQRRLYDYLAATIRDRGVAPTFRELQAFLGVRSLGSVTQRLDALEAKGWIARKSRKARAIRLLVRTVGEEE